MNTSVWVWAWRMSADVKWARVRVWIWARTSVHVSVSMCVYVGVYECEHQWVCVCSGRGRGRDAVCSRKVLHSSLFSENQTWRQVSWLRYFAQPSWNGNFIFINFFFSLEIPESLLQLRHQPGGKYLQAFTPLWFPLLDSLSLRNDFTCVSSLSGPRAFLSGFDY